MKAESGRAMERRTDLRRAQVPRCWDSRHLSMWKVAHNDVAAVWNRRTIFKSEWGVGRHGGRP